MAGIVKTARVLLFGGAGAGKTSAIMSLLKLAKIPGREAQKVVIVALDPNALMGIEDGLALHKIDLKEGQLFIVRPPRKKGISSFTVAARATKAYMKDTKDGTYQTAKQDTNNKKDYPFFADVQDLMVSLVGVDYVSGETVDLGNVGDLEEIDHLVLDSFTPLIEGLWQAVTGDKWIRGMEQYLIVQGQIKGLVFRLTQSIYCSLVVICHEETEKETGMLRPALSAGQSLHGSWTSAFSQVLYSYRTRQGQHVWAAKKNNVETVPRGFSDQEKLSDKLPPDFSIYNIF